MDFKVSDHRPTAKDKNVDYSDVETDLDEVAAWSFDNKGLKGLVATVADKAAKYHLMHQAKAYAADHGLVFRGYRSSDTEVDFRFNTPKS